MQMGSDQVLPNGGEWIRWTLGVVVGCVIGCLGFEIDQSREQAAMKQQIQDEIRHRDEQHTADQVSLSNSLVGISNSIDAVSKKVEGLQTIVLQPLIGKPSPSGLVFSHGLAFDK